MRVSEKLKERRPRKTFNWRLPSAVNLSEQGVPVAGLSEDVAEAWSSKYPLLGASPLNLFFFKRLFTGATFRNEAVAQLLRLVFGKLFEGFGLYATLAGK